MRKDKPNITFDELYENVNTYITSERELKKLSSAYLFAYEKHFGQKRLTGEDYITHPLNVAYILADINADTATLCAAILHDTLEDTDTTYEEIEKKFGSEIASLVNGVTKINKLNFSGDNEAVIANHRKILVGLCEDVRILILKLADRLHNMRTLWILSEKSQKANAKETLDILTPIAHRLGMNKIKSELEDLSLRYLKPDVYFDIVEKLNQTRVERDRIVKEMMDIVSKLLDDHGIKHEIKGRAKSIYSIYNKLDKGKRFSEIYDLLALRILVQTEQECYLALGIIHSKFRPLPKRFKDYIAMPKPNMYQSLHTTVFGIGGDLFEIQIRTHEMDEVAENGIAAHWSYKENKGSNSNANLTSTTEQKLQFFKSIIDLNKDNMNSEEFVKSVKDEVLNNNIYVFTPKGDVIELPKGATCVDFAYRVHSEVGDKMVGAIVNDSIVPFDYTLKTGDIIKVNTSKSSKGPNKDWLNFVVTSQARNKIKAFYTKREKDENLSRGSDMFEKALRRRNIPFNEITDDLELNDTIDEDDYKFLQENTDIMMKYIASVDSYYETNMDFLNKKIRNYFFDEEPHIYSKVDDYPPAKYNQGSLVKNSLISSGCIINGKVENMGQYDVVFICAPVWWYTAPMPVFSFIEQYDFKGKTVIPLCTAYSGPSSTLKDIVKATPDSDHRDGICIVTKEMGGTGMDKHHAKSDLRCSAIVGIS